MEEINEKSYKKESPIKYLLKNVGVLTISNFSSKILVFLLVPLYTNVLSTQEYGIYDLAISTLHLVYPIVTLNIVDAVMRFLMEPNNDKRDIISISGRIIVLSIVIVIVLFYLNSNLGLWKDINRYETWIVLYYIAYVFNQFFIQYCKGIERITVMAVAGVIGTIAMIGFNIIFLYVFEMGLTGFFFANTLSQAIPATYMFIKTKIWRQFSYNIDKKLQKDMLVYSIPLIMTTLGWWVNNTSNRYIVSFVCGTAATGLLSVASKIPTILSTVQQIFIQAWQITAIKEHGSENVTSFYRKMFDYLNMIMCIGCSILLILNDFLARILFANDFYEAVIYVPFLLISSVVNAASGFVGAILIAKKNSKILANSAIVGSIFNVVIGIILINIVGIQGATIATLLSSLVIYIYRLFVVKDLLSKVENIRTFLTWVLLLISAIVQIKGILEVVSIISLLIILFIYRVNIIEILKKIVRSYKSKKVKNV